MALQHLLLTYTAVTSYLVYCNVLYMELLLKMIRKFQFIQKWAARPLRLANAIFLCGVFSSALAVSLRDQSRRHASWGWWKLIKRTGDDNLYISLWLKSQWDECDWMNKMHIHLLRCFCLPEGILILYLISKSNFLAKETSTWFSLQCCFETCWNKFCSTVCFLIVLYKAKIPYLVSMTNTAFYKNNK